MRIKKGNKAFFMNRKLLSSKLNGKESKMKKNIHMYIYISTVRPLVTYAAETWFDGEGYDLFNDI
jgi:hypothetical protein